MLHKKKVKTHLIAPPPPKKIPGEHKYDKMKEHFYLIKIEKAKLTQSNDSKDDEIIELGEIP